MKTKLKRLPKNADFPPVVPVGLDAYRMWDKWAQQRIGVRAYMRSTYDRTGHNNTADASHYLYQQAEDFNVTLDVEGAGVLYFVRTNHWHGSPWHYEIDGVDHVVAESTTANPLQKLESAVFIPEHLFPNPLTYTYEATKGADLNWVPMAFEQRLRLAYSRTFYGTGYYIYHQFAAGTPVTQPLVAWNGNTRPDPQVLELLARAGEVTPQRGAISRGRAVLPANAVTQIATLDDGPATLRSFEFSVPADRATDFGKARLKIVWDGRFVPSVDAPVALFFGAGTLHNNDGREWLVKALPMGIRFADGRARLACRFPMPFFRSAVIELVMPDVSAIDVDWSLCVEPYVGAWNHAAYFHATFKDHGAPRLGHDLEFLDTQGVEGAADWSGSFVGTSLVFTDRNVLTTLEGDPRFFFDDSQTPQAQGTGTEEWGGGGDYWGGRTMTLPLAGHPVGVVDASLAKSPDDLIHSAYRFLLADLMPFGKRALIRFEHGGENESTEHYRSVTYWYGLPNPSIVLTDTLVMGDAASEAAHDFRCAESNAPYDVVSRFEWGPDHVPLALAAPLANPRDFVDYTFTAPAGTYDVWIETKAANDFFDAALWPQFNDEIGTNAHVAASMGSMGYLNVGATLGTFRFNTATAPVASVQLYTSGTQRLRIQPRLGNICMGRILLSPNRKKRPLVDVEPAADEVLLTPNDIVRTHGAFGVTNDAAAADGRAVALAEPPEAIEIFPAEKKTGRRIDSVCELTLAVRPDNHGVMLRRTLDYQYANQRAIVSVHTGNGWTHAGVWYLAGSNTVYHSFPRIEGELGAVRPVVITSNRRFRDDEFLLPVHLTRGQDRVRVRIEPAPRNPPLLQGGVPAATAWTAFVYHAYCWVMPRADLPE